FSIISLNYCLPFKMFFFQAEDGIRDRNVTGVQTCALPISSGNWVGLIRTAEARICAYMIALTHQASTGNSGSVTASWIRNGRTPTYCQREVTVSSPCVTWRTIVETISVHHPM